MSVMLAGGALVAGACFGVRTETSHVRLVGKPGAYELHRNGKPYFVRGAGGNGSQKMLVEAGANSIRTWGAEGLGEVLDKAHKDGLTVTAGIWLGHRPEFDYGDKAAVKKQFEMCKEVVQKYKDHPALLCWAFGNEAEGDGKDPRVYQAINEIAEMSKRIDPNHPTMTVIAEIGDRKVPSIHQLCPSIDIIGINSYGGAPSLAERYAKDGGTKPYMVTEFGPLGHWEAGTTRWGAPIEMSSTDKEAMYRKAYDGGVLRAAGTCLGSYVFLWGNKQEATSTWYGMLLPNGAHVGAFDVMAEIWTGKPRKNLTPRILELSVPQSDRLVPGQVITATLKATDPENKPIRVEWILSGEAVERLTAGRDERKPPLFPNAVTQPGQTSVKVKMPSTLGGYRLFVYVYDDAGGAAVANVPLYVGDSLPLNSN